MTMYQVMIFMTPEEEFMEGRQNVSPDVARSLMARRKLRNEGLIGGV